MGRKIEIYLGSASIEPGQLFEMTGRRTGGRRESCVPDLLSINCSSPDMIINFLRAGGKDILAAGAELPASHLESTAFTSSPIDSNAEFSLGVTNVTDKSQTCAAVLFLEKITKNKSDKRNLADDVLSEMNEEATHGDLDPDREAPGIIGRCLDWFVRGIAAAIADRKMVEDKGNVPLGQLLSPARVRDSLRRLVSDLVDVAEIPIEASALYWKQIADLAHGARTENAIPTTIGFGPQTIPANTRSKVTINLVGAMRPRRLKLSPYCRVHELQIVDLMAGKDSLLLGAGPIPGSFGIAGIDIGTDAIAWTSVDLVIVNTSQDEVDVSGVLEGDRMSFRSEEE